MAHPERKQKVDDYLSLWYVTLTKELPLEKPFAPSSSGAGFNQHICTWTRGHGVWFGGGSYEGPRKAKLAAIENNMLRSKTRFLWSFQSNSFNIHLPYTFYMLYLVGETQRCGPQSAGGDIPTKHSNMVSAVPEVCVRSYEILEEKLINDFRRNLNNSLSQAAWKLSFESWEVLEAMKAILESGKGTCILSRGSGWLARGRTEENKDGEAGWAGPHPQRGENGSLKAGQWYGLICSLRGSSWKQCCKRPENWD